eukprot:GGOE01019126.1.p2 GENE.GGOE01019126.1~~GGOE01019126.1.p2  ORF type:complete len:309 (+),score=49.20 GGOE01019126.1:41-967(+)
MGGADDQAQPPFHSFHPECLLHPRWLPGAVLSGLTLLTASALCTWAAASPSWLTLHPTAVPLRSKAVAMAAVHVGLRRSSPAAATTEDLGDADGAAALVKSGHPSTDLARAPCSLLALIIVALAVVAAVWRQRCRGGADVAPWGEERSLQGCVAASWRMAGAFSFAHGQVDLSLLPPGYDWGKGKGRGKGKGKGLWTHAYTPRMGKARYEGKGKGKGKGTSALVQASGRGKGMEATADVEGDTMDHLMPRYDPQLVDMFRAQMAPGVRWGTNTPYGKADGVYVDDSNKDWWDIRDDDDEEYRVPAEYL